jgi:hypothetical protein
MLDDFDGFDSVADPDGENAKLALKTYYNYVGAFCLLAPNVKNLLRDQAKLPSFSALQRVDAADEDEIRKPLHRCRLTVRMMKAVPVAQFPEVASAAIFWLPVQAYYAVHGAALATLYVLSHEQPFHHRKFLTSSANQILRLLPFPFCIRCNGDPQNSSSMSLVGCAVTPKEVERVSTIATLWDGNAELLAAKALVTTRKRDFERSCQEKRRKEGRKRLNARLRADVAKALQPTTVFDFYYRMRVRSNYDDPSMYVLGDFSSAVEAQRLYTDLLGLTTCVVRLLQEIVARKIGRDRFERVWKSGF